MLERARDETSVEHRTSDRGDITADGRLRILGRLDGLIDTGGETADPRRVELAILAIPGDRTAEVGIEPQQVGGGLVATIAVSGDLDEPTVRAALQPMLGRAEMPRRFLITR